MLVEINLLPTKEQKNKSLFLLIISFILVFLLMIGVYFYIGYQLEQKTQTTNEQIEQVEQLAAAQQEKLSTIESSNSSAELEKTIEWARTYPIELVPIINHLTELLPERGFIQKLSYEVTGELLVTVQFDESRESAYYQNSLSQSDWFKEVFLESVSTTGEFYELWEGYDENKIGNETYIPRYLAEYKLTIDEQTLQTQQNKESQDENSDSSNSEGGEES